MVIVVLLGFAALAVDVGYNRYEKRIEQSAADSAALAGAIERLSGTAYAVASAKHDASKNGFTDNTPAGAACTGKICVDVNTPPLTGGYTGDPTAVEVIIKSQRPSFFGRVLGSSGVTIAARAVARLRGDNNGCLFALDPVQATNLNQSTITGPGCSIYINGSTNLNGATVSAATIGIGNIGASNTGGIFPSAQPTAMPVPVPDPCMQIPGCAYLASNPPSTSGCVPGTFTNGQFANPGCYSSWSSSGTVTLNPGVYTFTGAIGVGQGTLDGTGVTLNFTGTAVPDFNKATLNLSAPVTGDTANMLFYGPSTTSANFNKTTNNFTGVMYLPKACPNLNKNGGGYTVYVLACANFNTSSMTFTAPSAGQSYIKTMVLAE